MSTVRHSHAGVRGKSQPARNRMIIAAVDAGVSMTLIDTDKPFPQREQERPSRYKNWFRCHGCGAEYAISDGVRSPRGCGNPTCYAPDIHIHSDRDGEIPQDEYVRIRSVWVPK